MMKLNYLFAALAVLFLVSCADDSSVDSVGSTPDPSIAINRSENAQLTTRLERVDGYLKGTNEYNYQLSSFLDDASLLMNLRYAREKQNTGQTLITDCVSFTASDTDFTALYINLWESLKTIHESRENETQYIRSIYFQDNSSEEVEEICIKVIIATEGTNSGGVGMDPSYGHDPSCEEVWLSGSWYWETKPAGTACSSVSIGIGAELELQNAVNDYIAQNPNLIVIPPSPYEISGYVTEKVEIIPFDIFHLNPNDAIIEDNCLDHRLFHRDTELPNFSKCIDADKLNFYYCEAIQYVYNENPDPHHFLVNSLSVEPVVSGFANMGEYRHEYTISYVTPIFVWGTWTSFDQGPIDNLGIPLI